MELNLTPALPEIFLTVAGMLLLVLGVFRKDDSTKTTAMLAVGAMAVAALLVLTSGGAKATTFNGQFVVDAFAVFVKVLILVASGTAIVMSIGYLEREKLSRFEYPVMMLFATVGMLMMASANNLISLYLGLELQSLALYVLAAYQRENSKATEAGLKYFVLGALASGLMLYGSSLIYGFAGTTSFEALAGLFKGGHAPSTGVLVGVIFLISGLAFKVSAVPFHMWTPDVYEGAPTPVTAFFAVAPKIAATSLLVRVLVGAFGDLLPQWQGVIELISTGSMILGAFAAIGQTNIKRLMAYSSIGHMGYALIGLAVGDAVGIRGVLVYLALYLFMNVGTFAIILSMRQKGRLLEGIDDLAGLAKTNPMVALAMAIFMFSMAGIPPMAGFWSKIAIFMAAIDAGLITLAVIGVLTSVVGTYYYLRIIKVMYFDEAVEPFDRGATKGLGFIMAVCALVVVLFTVTPNQLMTGAEAAASALFEG